MPFDVAAYDLVPADQQEFGAEPRDSSYTDVWRWSSQPAPPISGQIRTDSQNWQAATHVYISTTTDGGSSVGSILNSVVVGSTMTLVHATDSTRNVTWTVTAAPVAQGTYVDVMVAYVKSQGTIPNSGTQCNLTMVLPSGNLTPTLVTAVHVPSGFVHRHVSAFDPNIVLQELKDSPSPTMYLDYQTLTDANRQALLAVGVNSVFDQVRKAWAFWRLPA